MMSWLKTKRGLSFLAVSVLVLALASAYAVYAWTPVAVVDDPLVRMPGMQPGQVALEAPGRCLNCLEDRNRIGLINLDLTSGRVININRCHGRLDGVIGRYVTISGNIPASDRAYAILGVNCQSTRNDIDISITTINQSARRSGYRHRTSRVVNRIQD